MELKKNKKNKKNPAATQSLSMAEGKTASSSTMEIFWIHGYLVRSSTDGDCALSPAIRAAAPELQREHNPGAGAMHVLYCHI